MLDKIFPPQSTPPHRLPIHPPLPIRRVSEAAPLARRVSEADPPRPIPEASPLARRVSEAAPPRRVSKGQRPKRSEVPGTPLPPINPKRPKPPYFLLPLLSLTLFTAFPPPCHAAPAREYWLQQIDAAVQSGIEKGDLPGAVVLILHQGKIIHRKAYGLRARQPERIAMTPETVFDLASLTKPIATATSIHLLAEQGKLKLSDPVAKYWPEFGQQGKGSITIAQLLLHIGGLVADNPEADYAEGKTRALEKIAQLHPVAPVGRRFTYSDVGYIVLGELVERVAGQPLDRFAQEHLFAPLGMRATGFRPEAALRARAAPTQEHDGHWMIGEVHDPRAFRLGGVAGHAGLFATADDLARFALMLLQHGTHEGQRILQSETLRRLTAPEPVPGGWRSLGWDVDTAYSSNRGDLFPPHDGFGHTGFTGTSIWVHPPSQTAIIFLSNRVHPDGRGNVTRLRGIVASLAAAAVLPSAGTKKNLAAEPVQTGIDVLVQEKFERLRGRNIGLVTNHTGRDRQGHTTIDLLHRAPGVHLVALFSPEHGIRGTVEENVADSRDAATGLPVYSLYGARRKPTAETLKGIDTLIYDIQDAGCRFYTYISTLGHVLEAAGEHHLRMVVLDRPNPLGGSVVAGPMLDEGRESFVAYHRLPVQHGLTVGELAMLFNQERQLHADLDVVRLRGWQRDDRFDRTGLRWVNPSPNLRSLTAALLYPGIGLLEATNVSVGRGTERPFEWVGAPWIDGGRLAAELNALTLPGVRFMPTERTPTASVFKDQKCDGVQILVADWDQFAAVRTGLAFAWVLHHIYPEQWRIDRFNVLLGHQSTLEGLQKSRPWQALEAAWQPDLEVFLKLRKKYLLY